MKKYILGLIGIVFAFAMTFNLSSCSKEEVEPEKETPLIVGTWKYSWGDGYCLLKINKDMTAIYNEWDDGEWDAKDEKYNYVYDESKNIIYFYHPSGRQWETCQIASITKTEMRTLDFLDSGICIWKRQ